jgi:hypothetical protein
MTPEKLARFLYFFYKAYLKRCYAGVSAKDQDGKALDLSDIDLPGYLQKHVDIYVQHTDLNKEYERIYQTGLFYCKKNEKPEDFNELEIFFIENFRLFCHSISEAALAKKHPTLARVSLSFHPIDNENISLLALVEDAENS